jgi:hypothetical protein
VADNQSVYQGSAGNAFTVATDDVGGVHYQRVKLVDGTADSTTAIPAGGGTEASALRVTVASDSTGVLSVDDNGSTLSVDDGGGSLTVDGTVSVSGTVTVDTELTTADLDTGAGTDTRAVVGIAGAASGGAVLVQATSDGLLKVDASGASVPVTDGGGSLTVDGTVSVSGTVTVDTELTTADLDTGAGTDTRAVVGIAGAASGGAVLVQATSGGLLKVDASGASVPVTDGGGSLTVDGAVSVSGTVAATQSGTWNLGNDPSKLEDAPHASGDRGTYVLGVRRDALAVETSAAGDYGSFVTDQYGRMHVRDGKQTDPAMVTVKNHSPAANTQATASAAAAGAGVRWVCTAIMAGIAATGTAPTATSVTLNLRDGASGAGTVLWSAELGVPATAGATAGVAISDLWIPGSANTAMTLEFAAAGGANTKEWVNFTAVKLAE